MLNILKYFYNILRLNDNKLSFSIFTHLRVYKIWSKQKIIGKKPFEVELPWISIFSYLYLKKYLSKLKSLEINIFEYGSGGSSFFFLKNCSQLVSVEHDSEWYNKFTNEYIKNKKKWKYILSEPKNHKKLQPDYLNPLDYASAFSGYTSFDFSEYVKTIDEFPDYHFDIILIDGRSRLSCLYHAKNKIKKGGLIVLDNAERDRYFHLEILKSSEFELVVSHYGALMCSSGYVKTNIYRKINLR